MPQLPKAGLEITALPGSDQPQQITGQQIEERVGQFNVYDSPTIKPQIESLFASFEEKTGKKPSQSLDMLLRAAPFKDLKDLSSWVFTKEERDELDKHKELSSFKEAEAGALKGLDSSITEFKSSVQGQLDKLLAEAGIQAGEQRQTVGAGAAGSGLGRSTIAARQLGEVTLAEQARKGSLRESTATTFSTVDRLRDTTVQQIKKQREKIEEGKKISEAESKEQIRLTLDEADIRFSLQQELARLEINANEQNFLNSLIGGAISSYMQIITMGAGG